MRNPLALTSSMKRGALPLAIVVALNGVACDRSASPVGDATTPETQTRTATTTLSASTVAPRPSTAAPQPSASASATSAPATTQATAQPSQHERLYGTWVAHDVDTKMGDVKIRLTFKKQGPVSIMAWSDLPFVGQVRDKQAPYDVHGNTISSEAIRGGTSVQYRFDGGDLIIEYKDGKAVRFKRQG